MSAFVSPIPSSSLKIRSGSSSISSYSGVQLTTAPVHLTSFSVRRSRALQTLRMVHEGESAPDDTQMAEERKLFVGNLSWDTTDESLGEAFSRYGTVTDSRVIFNRFTGKSRGFGFIEYEAPDSASEALVGMNGVEVDGRAIRVDRATRRAPRPRFQDNYY